MKTLPRFTILINLGHRIAKLKVYAENIQLAILKAYNRFNHKQNCLSSYSPKMKIA